MRIVKRILKWTGIALAGLVTLVIIVVAVVLNTGAGARAALTQILPRLPVDVTVANFEGRLLRRFTITGIEVHDATFDVRVDTVYVEWRPTGLLRREVNVDRLLVAGVEASVREAGAAPAESPPDTGAAGPVRIELPVNVSVGEGYVRRVRATVPGGLQVNDVSLALAGSPDAYRVETRASVSGPEIPPVDLSVSANGDMDGARLEELRAELLDGVVSVAGTAVWYPGIEWDISLSVDTIAPGPLFPDSANFDGAVSMRASTKGKMGEDGPEAFVRIDSLSGSLRGERISGRGSFDVRRTGAILSPFSVAWGGMRVTVDGDAEWSPDVRWNVSLRADSVAPALFMPDPTLLPGAVTMHASTEGEMRKVEGGSEPLLIATLQVDSMAGELRGKPVRGRGRIDVRGQRVKADSFRVAWGSNDLEVSGVYDTEVDGTLRVVVPSLGDVYPDATGSVYIDARVRGPQREPAVAAVVSVDSLQLHEYRVDHLAVDADVDVLGSGAVSAEIHGYGIEASGERVDSLVVRADGDTAAHEVSLSVSSPRGSVTLEIAGSFSDPVWTGTLNHLDIRTAMFGDWSVDTKTTIEASPTHAGLSDLQLHSGGTSISMGGSWARGDTMRARVEIDSLAYALADTLMPEALTVSGWLDLDLNVQAAPSGDLRGRLNIDSSPGSISWNAGRETRQVGFDSTWVHGNVDSTGVSASLSMVVRRDKIVTRVSGEARLPGVSNFKAIPEDPEFNAAINAVFADLAFVNALSRDLKNVAGKLVIDATFEGTVSDPQFTGMLALTDAKADIVPVGLKIRDVTVIADGEKGQGVSVTGSMRSGGGTLELSTAVTRESGNIKVKGEDFEIVNTGEAQIRVSPDVGMKIEGRRVDLEGNVLVPYAKVEIFEVPPSAVGVSKDVVYVGVDSVEAKQPLEIFSDLRVTLAEDSVTFRGFGLYAEMQGSMSVRERPGRPTTASGELKITEGTYNAYGQILKIDPGFVRYAGGPIDNPGFDIRAYRDITEHSVRAGLKITGTARRPQITVFSDPAMSQNEALSYLLTGQPLSDGSQRDMAASAALSMGMAQGNAYMQSVGRDVGLDEMRFESGGTLEEASFVAGKYLSPQLYISNTMGLFDRVSTWRVRYFINRRWTLQAESGKATGSDLFYRFERGD